MSKGFSSVLAILVMLVSSAFMPTPEEGMYPISLLHTLDFAQMGMNLSPNDIYNEEGNGLINAIVNINGCTGSFISDEGLILTNHHCVFSALKPHTTEDNNYMKNGYLAQEKSLELPMQGYKVRIMKSYKDVTREVMIGVSAIKDPVARDAKIRENILVIKKKNEAEFPNVEIDVSEMLAGSSYVLFRYEYLTDIRLVYVPPRYVGEFGGETDNWMWPRHSGDFSFVRAYVGTDGKPADYSPANKPYQPQRYLQADFNGVQESDLVFILGYPGRTYRHYPSGFVAYMQQVQMPYIAQLWEWQIKQMEALSSQSTSLEIKYATKIKSLANTMKNYQGKMQSIERIDLINKKKGEESLVNILLSAKNETLAKQFQENLDKMNEAYQRLSDLGERRFWYGQLSQASQRADLAWILASYAQLTEDQRDSDILKKYLRAIRMAYRQYDPNTDSLFLGRMLRDGMRFKVDGLAEALDGKTPKDFVALVYAKAKINDSTYIINMVKKKPEKLAKTKDPLIRMQLLLAPGRASVADKSAAIDAETRSLQPAFVDLKMRATAGQFIPDANSTLRFTYGTVKGYTPNGTYMPPVTTVGGILQKADKGGEYVLGDELYHAIINSNSGEFFRNELGSVPVNILYNTDTSGGNSGSPVLNKDGHLVGLNFDRCFEACVNDFAWDDAYSRSIGVDIRYILWVTQHVGQAHHLIDEIRNQ